MDRRGRCAVWSGKVVFEALIKWSLIGLFVERRPAWKMDGFSCETNA